MSIQEINEQLFLSRSNLERCTKRPIRKPCISLWSFQRGVIEAAEKNGFEYIFAAGTVLGTGENYPRIGVLSIAWFAFNVFSLINRASAIVSKTNR